MAATAVQREAPKEAGCVGKAAVAKAAAGRAVVAAAAAGRALVAAAAAERAVVAAAAKLVARGAAPEAALVGSRSSGPPPGCAAAAT